MGVIDELEALERRRVEAAAVRFREIEEGFAKLREQAAELEARRTGALPPLEEPDQKIGASQECDEAGWTDDDSFWEFPRTWRT